MFEAGDTAIEFSLLDSRLPPCGALVGFLPTVAAELKRASAETGRSFVCQVTKRDKNLCGEHFPSEESAACASVVVFFPQVVVTSLVVLLWWLFDRTNVCGVGHCSLLLVRLFNMCVKRTRWGIAGWRGRGRGRAREGGGGGEGLTDGLG